MKVHELIDELKQLPPNTDVAAFNGRGELETPYVALYLKTRVTNPKTGKPGRKTTAMVLKCESDD
jgi:hypothetical protein